MIDAAARLDWTNEDIHGNCINQWQVMLAAAPTVSAEPCAFQILADGCKPDIVLDKWRADDLLRTTEALGIKAIVRPLYLHPPADVEWQPISTAPKDGTSVLLFTVDGVMEGYFCHGSWQNYVRGGPAEYFPTHWQPLPTPPKEGV